MANQLCPVKKRGLFSILYNDFDLGHIISQNYKFQQMGISFLIYKYYKIKEKLGHPGRLQNFLGNSVVQMFVVIYASDSLNIDQLSLEIRPPANLEY